MKARSDDDPRKLLGLLLRQARAEAGLTQDAIARAVNVERTGIARMEGGERLLSHAALGAWLERCAVTGLAEAGVRAMWRAARRYCDGDDPLKVWFVGWVDAERMAHLLRYWNPVLVPGIAQTPEYAYEVFRGGGHTQEQATADVGVRMQRQTVLNRVDPPTVVVVIWEAVLHHQVGTAEIMCAQLTRLLELSERPNVLVHVVPSARGANAGLGGPVSLATATGTADVLLTSCLVENVVTTDEAQVKAAISTFETVRGVAATVMESRRIITEARTLWETRQQTTGVSLATAQTAKHASRPPLTVV
jgi:transcriptional regulator with XRE-family HTH domain